MITNENIKSGADVELLLGADYIKQIIQSFFDAEAIPRSMTVEGGYRIEINPPANVQFIGDIEADVRADFQFLFYNPDGSRIAGVRGMTSILTKFLIKTSEDEEGNITDMRVGLQVTNFEGSLETVRNMANLASTLGGGPEISKAFILDLLNQNMGQEYPLNLFGKDKTVREIKTKKFVGQEYDEDAFGVYINLKLKEGPEDHAVFNNWIDLNEAVNFLPNGQAITFGMNDGMYDRLSSDIKQSFAEEKNAGKGDWHYPLKDRDETKGKIRSVRIAPKKSTVITGLGQYELIDDNALVVVIKGEVFLRKYMDIKPDFTIVVGLTPEIHNGVMEWKTSLISEDIDLTFWEELRLSFAVGFIIGWALSFFMGPAGLLVGGAITGLTMFAIDPIADAIGEDIIADMYKKYIDASLFDTIPDRVTTITRRQDPFHWTHYQVFTNINHYSITEAGFSLAGTATTGYEYEAIEHAVFKNEVRDSQDKIIGFDVRVKDYERIHEDYIDLFTRNQPEEHPELFYLSLSAIEARKMQKRFRSSLQFFYPFRIDKESGSIRRILTISELEKTEIENKHLRPHLSEKSQWFEANRRESTMQEVTEELEDDLNRGLEEKDEKEKNRRYNSKKKAWLEEQALAYRRGPIKPLYEADVQETIMLDMHPNEFGELQVRGLLAMVYTYQMIFMKQSQRFYYRTRANVTKLDNLGEMEEYESADATA